MTSTAPEFIKQRLIGNIEIFFWFSFLFCYFFQAPYIFLSKGIIPSLMLYLITLFLKKKVLPKGKTGIVLIVFLAYLCFEFLVGLQNPNATFASTTRFFLILAGIACCSFVNKDDFEKELKILIYLAVGKSFLIFIFAASVSIYGNFWVFRYWAKSLGIGDIYIINHIPKVQLLGNAMLPLAFIISVISKKKVNIPSIIILVGVLLSGNLSFYAAVFAYFIGIKIYDLFRARKTLLKSKRSIAAVIAVLAVILAFSAFFAVKVVDKALNSPSIAVKIDQTAVLLDCNVVFGEGLGNLLTAKKHLFNSDTYTDYFFEMQSFYIVNQVGFIGFFMLHTVVIWQLFLKNKRNIFLYIVYLMYTFVNPYCYDTLHMAVVIILMNANFERALPAAKIPQIRKISFNNTE